MRNRKELKHEMSFNFNICRDGCAMECKGIYNDIQITAINIVEAVVNPTVSNSCSSNRLFLVLCSSINAV